MKKVLLSLMAIIILAVSLLPMTASAWETPALLLGTVYNMDEQTITLYYRVVNFEGTESADFRLRYNPDVVEYVEHETPKMSNVFIEIGHQAEKPDTIAIQFVDLYYVEAEDCEEDGSATVATFTFKVKDEKAKETVFIAFTDSYAMDPNSTEVFVERVTHKIALNSQSEKTATPDDYDIPEFALDEDFGDSETDADNSVMSENLKKVIIAASVAAAVFVGGIVVIVIKYRKK